MPAVSVASGEPPSLDLDFDVKINDYCEFTKNSASVDGGGIFMYYTKYVDVVGRVTFIGNEAR